MSLNIKGIWDEIMKGEDGDVIGTIFAEIEKFFNDLLIFLREELL